MNALLENMLISALTGLASAATALQPVLVIKMFPEPGDWLSAGIAFIVTFAGVALNGLRQKQKDPHE